MTMVTELILYCVYLTDDSNNWMLDYSQYLLSVQGLCVREKLVCVTTVCTLFFCFLSVWFAHHIFMCFFYISFPPKMNKSFILFSISNFSSCQPALAFQFLFFSFHSYSTWTTFSSPPSHHSLLTTLNNEYNSTSSLPLLCCVLLSFFSLYLSLSFSLCQIWLISWSDCWPSMTICLKSLSHTPWAGMVRQRAGKWEG